MEESKTNKTRILVVDDEIDICTMLQDALSTYGFEVKYSTRGKEAIEIFKDFYPHFVLLDIMMPEMSGIDVLEQIREVDKNGV
ncbi:response regulator [bacterium]|nr:response regulator [bacterium]